MASPKEKFDLDAERASKRGFGGYLKDRAFGSADFEKAPTPVKKAGAAIIGESSMNKSDREEAGFKKGGRVKVAPAKKSCW